MTLSLSSLPAGLWRASELARYSRPGHATGFAALDDELPGGGWPHGAVTELLSERPGVGEWRLLAPALRALTQADQPVVIIAPPMLPYAPALAGWGIDLRWLTVIEAQTKHAQRPQRPASGEDRDMLWCAEQALKSACCGALLAWLPAATPEQVRRLQVAAGGSDALAWLMRPAKVAATSSAAPLRLGLSVGEGSRLAVHFHKRRGPPRSEPLWLTLPAPYVRRPISPLLSTGDAHGLLDRPASAPTGARDRLPAHAG